MEKLWKLIFTDIFSMNVFENGNFSDIHILIVMNAEKIYTNIYYSYYLISNSLIIYTVLYIYSINKFYS